MLLSLGLPTSVPQDKDLKQLVYLGNKLSRRGGEGIRRVKWGRKSQSQDNVHYWLGFLWGWLLFLVVPETTSLNYVSKALKGEVLVCKLLSVKRIEGCPMKFAFSALWGYICVTPLEPACIQPAPRADSEKSVWYKLEMRHC